MQMTIKPQEIVLLFDNDFDIGELFHAIIRHLDQVHNEQREHLNHMLAENASAEPQDHYPF